MDGIEAHVAYDVATDEILIAGSQTSGGIRRALELDAEGRLVARELGRDERRRMILRVPHSSEFLKALAAALIREGFAPKDEQAGARMDHLKDARETRDRLLVMIEKKGL